MRQLLGQVPLPDPPSLQRLSWAPRAASVVQRVVNDSDLAELSEANVRFTRTTIR